jgi:hypothetical protein
LTARALDLLAERYGRMPHELLDMGAFDVGIDYEVLTKATAK